MNKAGVETGLNANARKVLLVTFGSLGDLHPFIALAHGLKREGLAPVIATSASFADRVTREGVEFAPMRPRPDELTTRLGVDEAEIARRMAQDENFIFESVILPHLRDSYDDLIAASAGARAIVAHPTVFAAPLAAETRSVPLVTALLLPMMLSSAQARAPGPREDAASAPTARFSEPRLPRWSFEPLRQQRRELGLPPRYGLDLLFGAKSRAATIALFSPTLAPQYTDPTSRLLIAGHTFHDRLAGNESLSPGLEAFLAQGSAPIAFTLGSFIAFDRLDHYRACAAAAQRLGRRALLLVPKRDLPALADRHGAQTYVESYSPYSLVFEKVCAIVHHGGIGAAGLALRAGRPQIVTAFIPDHFDTGERLRRLGVAHVIRGEAMTAEALAHKLAGVLDQESYAARASEIAEIVRQEDGAAVAARRIAQLVEGA